MPLPEYIFVGDVLTFTFDVTDPLTGLPVDLTLYDALAVVFTGPRGGGSFTATPALPGGGADGVCAYQTTPGQLSAAGPWRAQVVGSRGGAVWNHSSEFGFDVYQP